jgi:hypothetical protein
MPLPSTKRCLRLKTAIAEEVGNIQGMAERFIAESNDYVKQRVKQATFDPDAGEDPIKVRYSTAPIADTPYVDLLVSGHETTEHGTRDCAGQYAGLSATGDVRGAFGCNLPGQSIRGGYDVFTRTLKGKAWETEPFCALDLLLKKHAEAYIAMLRGDLPRRAMEQFNFSLERNVIELGRYNTSATSGFVTAAGEFPAIPAGRIDLGTVRRLAAIVKVQGWTGPFEVQISAEAFERMRLDYKTNNDVVLEATLASNETHHLGDDVQAIMWGGIRWVITDTPTRGYLRPNASGGYDFVPVRPTIARAGTGEGIVVDVNEDWFEGYTWCDGVRYELYEASFFVHPDAATREGFAMPRMAGKQWSSNLFNFEVNLVDGAYLDCNKDNFKGQFRILHAYAFESLKPELMGAILHRVAPERIYVNAPDDEPAEPDLDSIVPLEPAPLPADDCSLDDISTEGCDDPTLHLLPLQTEDNPNPASVVGSLRYKDGIANTVLAGNTLRVRVERVGGTSGAASVTLTPTEGTATDPEDFADPGATVLSWADGEAGDKYVDIPVEADATDASVFTVVASSPSGAAWTTNLTKTVTIEA